MKIYTKIDDIPANLKKAESNYKENELEIKNEILKDINYLSLNYKNLNLWNKKYNPQIYNSIMCNQNLDIQNNKKNYYIIASTPDAKYANKNYPDNVILPIKSHINNLNQNEIRWQIGLEETKTSFTLNKQKPGDPFKNPNIKVKKNRGYDFDGKETYINECIIPGFDEKDNYWDDIQKNIILAIKSKNSKYYTTIDNGLLINFTSRLIPLIIENGAKERELNSELEVKNFVIQFVKELESLIETKKEIISNISFVIVFFSIFADKEPYIYNLWLPCFRKGIYKNIWNFETNEKKEYKIQSILNKDKNNKFYISILNN